MGMDAGAPKPLAGLALGGMWVIRGPVSAAQETSWCAGKATAVGQISHCGVWPPWASGSLVPYEIKQKCLSMCTFLPSRDKI